MTENELYLITGLSILAGFCSGLTFSIEIRKCRRLGYIGRWFEFFVALFWASCLIINFWTILTITVNEAQKDNGAGVENLLPTAVRSN